MDSPKANIENDSLLELDPFSGYALMDRNTRMRGRALYPYGCDNWRSGSNSRPSRYQRQYLFPGLYIWARLGQQLLGISSPTTLERRVSWVWQNCPIIPQIWCNNRWCWWVNCFDGIACRCLPRRGGDGEISTSPRNEYRGTRLQRKKPPCTVPHMEKWWTVPAVKQTWPC